MADLADVVDELYALDPDQFTATRNARAKQAASEGDRELADRVRALPKPSAAAWAVNTLARLQPDRLDELLRLGESLREAQSHLDARSLRELAQRRRTLVVAVALEAVHAAERGGRALGGTVIDQVEQTLTAAMVDAAAADAVRSGSLVRALQAVGLEVDVTNAVALVGGRPARRHAPKGRASKAEREDELAAQRQKRRRQADDAAAAAAEAEAAARDAEASAVAARGVAEAAAARRDALEAETDALRRRLDELGGRLGDAERARTESRRAAEQAERELTRAKRAATAAREHADRLAEKLR